MSIIKRLAGSLSPIWIILVANLIVFLLILRTLLRYYHAHNPFWYLFAVEEILVAGFTVWQIRSVRRLTQNRTANRPLD